MIKITLTAKKSAIRMTYFLVKRIFVMHKRLNPNKKCTSQLNSLEELGLQFSLMNTMCSQFFICWCSSSHGSFSMATLIRTSDSRWRVKATRGSLNGLVARLKKSHSWRTSLEVGASVLALSVNFIYQIICSFITCEWLCLFVQALLNLHSVVVFLFFKMF